jgi:hypothetical protein
MATPTIEREQEQKPPQPIGCPVCGAAMGPRRGTYRCSRCGLELCVGCEAQQTHDEAA